MADLDEDLSGDAGTRTTATERLWTEARIDPVEIALPTGTGYTLRAYRPADEVTPTEVVKGEEDEDLFVAARRRRERVADEDEDDEEPDDVEEDVDGKRKSDDEDDDAEDDDALDEDEQDSDLDNADDLDAADTDDVPIFLGHRGKLFLFRSPESLVEFVRSAAEHDLAQLDTWASLSERLSPDDVVPTDDDTYELDLVVDNLRGGHDAWDAALVISAGECARDVAYAFRQEAIMTALSPGSPLDDLDEALRATVAGGLGSFLARRRLRKIGAQQATLGWRTIVGKISGVVDWRD